MGDVSPASEKAVPVTTTPRISRKEIGGGKQLSRRSTTADSIINATPPISPRHQSPLLASTRNLNTYNHNANGPLEVHGSVPPERHEIGNDGQVTNTMNARGMELDSQTVASRYPPGTEWDGSTVAGGSHYGGSGFQQSPQSHPQYAARDVDGAHNRWGKRQEMAADQGQGKWAQRQELPGN
jgi:hypothetical protein